MLPYMAKGILQEHPDDPQPRVHLQMGRNCLKIVEKIFLLQQSYNKAKRLTFQKHKNLEVTQTQ